MVSGIHHHDRCVTVHFNVDLPATVVDMEGPSAQEWREHAEDYQEDGERLVAVLIVGKGVEFWFRKTGEQN